MQQTAAAAAPFEDIVISTQDYFYIAHRMREPGRDMRTDVHASFMEALENAIIVESERLPDKVVRIGSTVTVADCDTGAERTFDLVRGAGTRHPDRLAVLTILGSSLIGVPEGRTIAYETADGQARRLRVLSVRNAHTRTTRFPGFPSC